MGGLRRPAGRAGRRQCLCKDADSTPVGALLAGAEHCVFLAGPRRRVGDGEGLGCLQCFASPMQNRV